MRGADQIAGSSQIPGPTLRPYNRKTPEAGPKLYEHPPCRIWISNYSQHYSAGWNRLSVPYRTSSKLPSSFRWSRLRSWAPEICSTAVPLGTGWRQICPFTRVSRKQMDTRASGRLDGATLRSRAGQVYFDGLWECLSLSRHRRLTSPRSRRHRLHIAHLQRSTPTPGRRQQQSTTPSLPSAKTTLPARKPGRHTPTSAHDQPGNAGQSGQRAGRQTPPPQRANSTRSPIYRIARGAIES